MDWMKHPQFDATRQWSIPITGMTCAFCVSRVEKALARVPGVQDATVNLATERASVRGNETVNIASLRAAVARAGYAIPEQRIALQIDV